MVHGEVEISVADWPRWGRRKRAFVFAALISAGAISPRGTLELMSFSCKYLHALVSGTGKLDAVSPRARQRLTSEADGPQMWWRIRWLAGPPAVCQQGRGDVFLDVSLAPSHLPAMTSLPDWDRVFNPQFQLFKARRQPLICSPHLQQTFTKKKKKKTGLKVKWTKHSMSSILLNSFLFGHRNEFPSKCSISLLANA